MTYKLCKKCAYFSAHKDKGIYYNPTQLDGDCLKIEHGVNCTEWSDDPDNIEDIIKDEYKNNLAFCHDGSGYSATVTVAENFGCVMWEPKE